MSSRGNWEQALPRFSLGRRVTVVVLMAAALVVGAIATAGIPLELIPRGFEAPRLSIIVFWRDAPAREVLDKVVLTLEEELSTVRGVELLTSYASKGRADVDLSFKQGVDMDVAYREVRDRLLRARPRMPDDIEPVRIFKETADAVPVMLVGVAIDESVTDAYNLVQREIITPLQRVDGVASVTAEGLEEKEVLIELDREATAAAGLNAFVIASQLSDDNFSIASGTVRDGERKLLLRSLARYDDLEEIRNQRLNGSVRLGDIAVVRYAEPDRFWRVRVNSKPALAIQVYKEGQANTIEVGTALTEAFTRIRNNPKLAGSDVEILFAQADVIKESLATLIGSGKQGALLAALVLLFFLRRFRLTLIITMAIPLSMVIALIAMYFTGETLNVLSLLGLIISIGLLVDNSIVVAENIHRLYQEGMPRREACIAGAAEIALAIILATLTTIIVFLPVALVEGRAQFFLVRLAMPITVSLAASLAVALVFVPLCVYLTLGRAPRGRGVRRGVVIVHLVMDRVLGTAYRYSLGAFNALYVRLLVVCLRRRSDLVIGTIALFALTMAGPRQGIEVVEVSREDSQSFRISVELPPNSNLEDAEVLFGKVEDALASVKAELGLEGYFVLHTAQGGDVQGWFPDQKRLTRREITERVLAVLPKAPGVKYYAGNEARGKEEEERALYTVALEGEDPDVLEAIGKQLEELLVQVDGVIGVKRANEFAPNELGLVVDRELAERQGVNPRVIAGVVAVGLRGQPLPRFQQNGREVPVRLRFAEEDRQSLEELKDFSVPTRSGELVQLSSVTELRYLSSPRGIFRAGKSTTRRVTAELGQGVEKVTRARLDAVVGRLDLPEGVRVARSSAAVQLDDDIAAMRFAALTSILFIYLLMGFLFESFILPLSIILTIPMASIGVVWAHVLAGRELDYLGFVGVVLLIGVVVNNGIVFVDYVNRLRQLGRERSEAIVLAARRRFRPIMMTALTTICGMIPLTVGEPTSVGLSYTSFGLTLMGGMATATALTLLVVPVFYTLFDDGRDRLLAVLGAAFARPAPSSRDESAGR